MRRCRSVLSNGQVVLGTIYFDRLTIQTYLKILPTRLVGIPENHRDLVDLFIPFGDNFLANEGLESLANLSNCFTFRIQSINLDGASYFWLEN